MSAGLTCKQCKRVAMVPTDDALEDALSRVEDGGDVSLPVTCCYCGATGTVKDAAALDYASLHGHSIREAVEADKRREAEKVERLKQGRW